jgi:hypothetical protein
MAMLFMEISGPRGEELALAAGDAIGVPVGADPDEASATFDSDEHASEQELETAVVEALLQLDPDWQSHLRVAE